VALIFSHYVTSFNFDIRRNKSKFILKILIGDSLSQFLIHSLCGPCANPLAESLIWLLNPQGELCNKEQKVHSSKAHEAIKTQTNV
jgi:hypothetical protein